MYKRELAKETDNRAVSDKQPTAPYTNDGDCTII